MTEANHDDGAAANEIPPDLAALTRFLELADLLTPYAIRVAISLGLPKHIDTGISAVDALASAVDVDPGALTSLLGHLEERGLVARAEDSTYQLSAVGAFMLHDDAEFHLDLRGATAAMDLAWAGLFHSLRTGGPGYPQVHGQGFWDHLEADPALGANFDEYMRRASTWTAEAAQSDLWPASGTVVDVGGGDGRLLCDLLARHPDLRGVLVELAATAERASSRFADADLIDRVEIVEASFFEPLPTHGDVYVLGQVLHDWPDDQATAILSRVRDAVGEYGRAFVIDQVLGENTRTPFQARTDLLMRLLFASHERTRTEWEALAATADLRVEDIHPCDGIRMLIELRARA